MQLEGYVIERRFKNPSPFRAQTKEHLGLGDNFPCKYSPVVHYGDSCTICQTTGQWLLSRIEIHFWPLVQIPPGSSCALPALSTLNFWSVSNSEQGSMDAAWATLCCFVVGFFLKQDKANVGKLCTSKLQPLIWASCQICVHRFIQQWDRGSSLVTVSPYC